MSPTNKAFDISNYEARRLVTRLDGHSNYTPVDICRAITGSYLAPQASEAADVLIAALQTVASTHEVANTITRLRIIKQELIALENKDEFSEEAPIGLVRCFCDCYDNPTYEDFTTMLHKLIPGH